jgi:hypothetical protein
VELLLLLIGAAFVVLFIINNLVRTALRQYDISKWELRLAFFAALLPISALIVDNLEQAQFGTLEEMMFLLIIPLTIISIGLFVVEGFRKQRWKQSRGVFGLGIALLLLLSTLTYNFISFQARLNIVEVNVVPTPVNASEDSLSPCEREFIGLTAFIFQQINNYTGLTEDELADEFIDGERSLGQLIENNDRNPQQFIQSIRDEFDTTAPELVSLGCATGAELNGARLAFNIFLPRLVNTPINETPDVINGVAEFFGQEPVLQFESDAAFRATREALIASVPTEGLDVPELPSPTATFTPSVTPSPTATRTPLPTLSPTPTRERFQTPTPTLTPTLPDPCLATASFNVNMRTLPDLEEGDVILTIPFESVFSVFAPNEDETWWFGQYEGESGWISGEFIALTSACDDLPPRRP